jgi:hypothetical protein
MTDRLRIAVTGLAATYPLGGVFWDYAQYLLGLKRLGHDVLYIEDSGKWCYDAAHQTFIRDGSGNAVVFARDIAALDPELADRWFFRDAAGTGYGRRWPDVVNFCRTADLFIHVSASCWMRDEYFEAARVAFIDSDPMYTQASVPGYVPVPPTAPVDAASGKPSVLTIQQVRYRVADALGTEPLEVTTAEGKRSLDPVDVAIYLSYRLTHTSTDEISYRFGVADARRVRGAIRVVHGLLREGGAFSDTVGRVAGQLRVDILRHHDVFFTFAENIGAPDCRVPQAHFHWIPTRQPVVIDQFAPFALPPANRRRVLTTVASWESAEGGLVMNGVAYGGKNVEFERFIELPDRVSVPLELALSGRPPRERLAAHGWRVIDAVHVSNDPWTYRDFLMRSLGEWSVAKHAYVASRSGWFSCRTACYLALGVPAVVQSTGFETVIPTGAGISTFSTAEEAADAIERLVAEPERHSRAATDVAMQHFSSDIVLSTLIDRALAAPTPDAHGRQDVFTRLSHHA